MSSPDEDFLALPLDALADAALSVARAAGAEHADLRVQRMRTGDIALRDARLAASSDGEHAGLAVRVLLDGVWGFAATDQLTPDAAAATARQALEVARICRPLAAERTELAPEPVHRETWVGPGRLDPFEVPAHERVTLLAERSARLLGTGAVLHVDADVSMLKEQKFYADLAGSRIVQQRLLIHPSVTVHGLDDGGPESLRTLVGPSARGWEYLTGDGWDAEAELAELPELLAERMAAPPVVAGTYDLVIDPTNLWLTIHESVGHATELDRSLGYEAAYAGTSFATLDGLGRLRYGSDLMTVIGDRTAEYGCATVGFDDEGVRTQSWDLVRDGMLTGFQLDRAMAARCAAALGTDASNGCAYADSALSVPVQRMANVSLQPVGTASTADLISGVDDGIYVVGDRSWSIDMQRYNFQFTAQRFYRIRNGRLAGQVKDAAYQGSTPSFWGSLAAVGGPDTYVMGGAPNCGKAQPGQTAWVSHGSPSTMFRAVTVLNTRAEAGR